MKKITSLLLTLLMVATAWAQGGSGVGYDPVNPPDPEMGYRLTVKASPDKGGNVTPSRPQYVKAGEDVRVEANPRLGYAFRAWMDGDSVVSTDQYYYFTMPENAVVLTAWFDKTEYNPANPGDPFIEGYEHRVSVYATPSIGGHANNSNFYMREGDETYLYAYPNSAFKFVCWKQDGKIISTDRELPIKMGDKNLEYTMQFAYDPTNPSDPGTNSWNPSTGELIMDHFDRGNLWGAINDLMGGDGFESVSELTVIGPIDDYDFNTVSQMPGLTVADFSRTSGCTFVPNSSFWNNEALTKILLPSSITFIDSFAFIGCPNLSELVVYASMPPQVYEETFYNVPDNLVVKVYSSSLDVYQNTPIWSNYKIMTIDDDSTALSVTLPADAADGRYRNASLQLSNLSTGQTQKLVVTGSRIRFVFGNLIPDMKYSLYALAPNGNVIGSYLDFEIPAEGFDYQFESLLQLKDVRLALLTPDGKDVAESANVSWFDEKHSLLGSGASLPGQVEGYTVYYEVSLPRDLGILYAAPENGEWKMTNGENVAEVTLVPFATTEIKGTLTDEKFGEPVIGGYVTASQTLNGYAVSSSAVTGEDGSYVLTIYDVPGTLTAGSPDHFEASADFENAAGASALGNMKVKPLAGVDINLSLLSRDNIVKGDANNEFTDYADYANVDFRVFNTTTNKEVENVRLKYPRLIIFDDIQDGDVLDITATPKNSAFNAATERVTVAEGGAEAKITFTSNGDIAASYAASEAEEVVALLYGADGNLVKTVSYVDGNADFIGLPDGTYTLVSMMACKLFSSAGTLQELYGTDLEAGKDYVVSDVTVETGYISQVMIPNVPVFDESAFYYTSPETAITVNKTSVTVGSIVTVRSNVKFLPEYADGIERVKITFNIPEGCEYVENSLLVAGDGSNFTTIENGVISVDLPVKDASPRFCIIPRQGGDYRPSASIEFEYNGQIIRQPIGFALFTAGDFTLSVPAKTSVPRITARGAATALSEVRVYDNDMFIGSTRTLTNGEWRLTFDLYNPGDYSEHMIYAEITTPEGVKYKTTVAKTIYDKEWVELTDIYMIYGGTTVDFNHIDATTLPVSYSYVPGNDMFTFKAIFREGHAEKVDRLEFVILLSDGSRRKIEGKYLKSQGAWVCALGFPDVNRLPVNVKVLYTELRRKVEGVTVELIDDVAETFRCPDVIPVIDPSGYVYEAVPSNRLQGVTATIFYKEYVEDMYGDLHETEVKWDAEAYAQQNPLFTDENGMYQWDVPQGEWQVRFEKEGYETISTDWLPVPPPQLDVNVGMTQTVRPEVIDAKAYGQAVEVSFDKYMDISTLNASNIAVVANGVNVEGSISFLDEEAASDEVSYASKVRFEAAEPFDAEVVTLMVSSKVKSYAGINMEESFTQEFTIEPEISAIEAPESLSAYVDVPAKVTVKVSPAEAAAGKMLLASINTPIAAVSDAVEIDDNGTAIVEINGELPGQAVVTYTVEGSSIEGVSTMVEFDVVEDEIPAYAPVASVESGSEVLIGTEVALSSATEGAEIWYTVDGTSPLDSETKALYEAPIAIKENVKILAVAKAEGYLDSEVAEFSYTIPAPVAAPEASVATGSEVLIGTEVALASASEEADIWYTVDGTSPIDSETKALYDAPIVIKENVKILAVARLAGYPDSEVVEFSYTIPAPVAAPVASVPSGEVNEGIEVTLSSSTEEAVIWYTVDGTSPLASNTAKVYDSPIVVDEAMKILAVATLAGYPDSEVVEFSYTLPAPPPVVFAAAPEASVASGEVKIGTKVELSSATKNAEVWYTVDGTSPFSSETAALYDAPIVIERDTKILAVAKLAGYSDSEVAEFNYTIPAPVAAPTASVASGEVNAGTEVALSCATVGADIWYTIDGTSPLDSKTAKLYTTPLVVETAVTIRAAATLAGYPDSQIADFSYTLPAPSPIVAAEAPTASVASGEVKIGTEVVLSSATPDANIWYTLDGSSPIDSFTRKRYIAPIVISKDTKILAVTKLPGYADSEVSEFNYTIPAPLSAPVASVASGEVNAGTEVALSCANEEAEIWFTLDGTSPLKSETAKLYDSPIVVDEAVMILAVATLAGYPDSEVAEFNYTVAEPLPIEPVAAPVASVASESQVKPGTEVELYTSTEGAEIWYTLDGTSPLDSATRILYDESIVIDEETTVLAVAQLAGYPDSEVVTFHYTVEKSTGVDSVSAAHLKIEVAPHGEEIKITGVCGRDAYVYVYDTNGKAVTPARKISGDETIRLNSMLVGVYVVTVVADNESATVKFRK